MSEETSAESNSRRGFLKRAATVSGALPLSHGLVAGVASASLAAPASAAATAASRVNDLAGYTSLSPEEATVIETIVNVMCPADEFTANGVDCGLAIYIDRQLAGSFGKGAKRYLRGPWEQGKPEQGWQLPLTPEQFFKQGAAAFMQATKIRFGKSLDQLSTSEVDTILKDLAAGKVADADVNLSSWFNELIYPLFEQACFSDPIYGGNRDKVFWKAIGYPGLPATNTVNMVRFRGKPFPGAKNPKSIADFS